MDKSLIGHVQCVRAIYWPRDSEVTLTFMSKSGRYQTIPNIKREPFTYFSWDVHFIYHIISYHIIYHIMSYHISCHAMPCHAMPCHAIPCIHAMPCHAMPCHIISYHVNFDLQGRQENRNSKKANIVPADDLLTSGTRVSANSTFIWFPQMVQTPLTPLFSTGGDMYHLINTKVKLHGLIQPTNLGPFY